MSVVIRKELPRAARPDEAVCIDVEMFGQDVERLHRPHGTFACISVAYSEDEVYQIYDTADLPELFKRIQYAGIWVLHNALYDLRQLSKWVVFTERPIHDTMLYEQGLWGGYYDTFGLKDCVRRYLDIHMDKETRDEFETATEMTPAMQEYAALDVVYTLKVREAQLALERDEMQKVYWKIDAPMIWVVMDTLPMKVDVERWTNLAIEFSAKAKELEAQLGFNVKSPDQVKKALADIGIRVKDTRKDTLDNLPDNPITKVVRQTRQYRDAVSKYGFKWIAQHVEEGDLVYPDWKIRNAKTGRMACASPNAMNIPTREMPIYREFFIPFYDVLGDWDISQQEPRITCYLSGDKGLKQAFDSGEDIHLYVTRAIYNDPTITKHDDRRKTGKAINLGLTYGLTAEGLAERTGMTLAESNRIIAAYFTRFPGVAQYVTRMRTMALNRGYVTTALGARLWINPYDFHWQNNAINSPIQGGAAEFTKRWAYLTWKWEQTLRIPFSICGYIHDEILHDVHEGYRKQTEEIVTDAFHQTANEQYPGIPFEIEGGFGMNWRTAKPE